MKMLKNRTGQHGAFQNHMIRENIEMTAGSEFVFVKQAHLYC